MDIQLLLEVNQDCEMGFINVEIHKFVDSIGFPQVSNPFVSLFYLYALLTRPFL